MNRIRQAVVMVGGRGTRLLPLTETRPKPILPVADRPCIWYLLRSMARAGIEHVILACGYKPGMMEALGDGSDLGMEIVYSYEDRPMGTAGAMKLVEDRLDDHFVAANGDVFADIDIAAEIRTHFEHEASITDALTPVDNPCDYGIACVDEDLRITAFKDKPRPDEVFSNLINAGVYVVDRDVLGHVPQGRFFDFSMDLIPIIIAEGQRIQGYRLSGLWMDVGRPRDLYRASISVAEREHGGSILGESTGSMFEGTCYAGPYAKIRDSCLSESVVMNGCSLDGSTLNRSLLLPGCVVGRADIRNSILGEGCIVCDGATVVDAVLGDGTLVRAGDRIEGDRPF